MKILITGGSGFIGRNLAEQYEGGFELAVPSRAELDLMDDAAVRTYLERRRFDVVIHAATERSNRMVGSGPELLRRNCRMFFNLARNSHAFGRMLFLSSGAVYSRVHSYPRMPEDYFDRYIPADDYGFSKYICAKAIGGMERIYELRLFGVFGPHEDWRVRFISNACCRAQWGLPIVIRQNVFFDYLDVLDLGRILECYVRKELRYRHYNVCTGQATDLATLAAKVVTISGKNLEITVKTPGLGSEYSGNNSRMLLEFPGFSFSNIEQSIARLYRWYGERKSDIEQSELSFDA